MELTATVNEITKAASLLNDRGRWVTLQQCMALAQQKIYQNKEAIGEFQKQTGIIVEKPDNEKDQDEFGRQDQKKRVEGDLQLEGYILLGWYQGREDEVCNSNWLKSKYGLISELGMAAYLPKSGARWVYIFNTHARYAPHPDPMWENKRWTYFAETDKNKSGCCNHQPVTPRRRSIKEMRHLFSQTKPDSYKERYPEKAWILSVPLWLLDEKKDMRPLYLTGGKPE